MASSGVLLSLTGVQHKKNPGQLLVTTDRVVFCSTDAKKLSVGRASITGCVANRSAPYKAQMSTAAKAYVFVFPDEPSRDQFVAVVKSAPSSPAPAWESSPPAITSASTEAQIRALLLARDPQLRRAYQEVVEQGKIISSAEFWRSRQHLIELERHSTQAQRVGLSSAMLSAVPIADATQPGPSGSTIAYTLSAGAIAEILAKHGAVRRAYEDQVPDKMSETEFWTKYFQSQYFRRARQQFVGADADADAVIQPMHDIFSRFEAAPKETDRDADLKADLPVDRFVDLTLLDPDREDRLLHPKVLPASVRDKQRHELITEFNQHSRVVLRTAGRITDSQPLDMADSAAVPAHEIQLATGGQAETVTPLSETAQDAVRQAFLHHVDSSVGAGPDSQQRATYLSGVITRLSQDCRITEQQAATQRSGTFVIFNRQRGLDEKVPDKILDAVRSRAVKASELLRHFWGCFPVHDADARARLERYTTALAALDADIQKLRRKLHDNNYSVFVPMFDATMRMLQEAAERGQEALQAAKDHTGRHVPPEAKRLRVE
ncbi:hypothetical protein PBRA_003908 [Plasmodiophora brassicae]|uniref:BSD domain-containing protein n=1 Tax=Plasmodiophora brassicae TaxID=37360 RepID=A0A0G4IJ84_PLABS|nr:hypothetical protein PBRA_003908 [Plasmodiophora brassicae]